MRLIWMDNIIKLKAAHVCRRDGCDFQDDHQAAWCEIDQASTREADKDQDRPARCGLDYIASRGVDQTKPTQDKDFVNDEKLVRVLRPDYVRSSFKLTFEADKE